MRDNLSVIITALILVILIIIFPLYNVFERQDDMSYNIVLKATSEFADEVLQNGYISEEMYSNFVSELAITGNLYDIQLEAHKKKIIQEPKKDRHDPNEPTVFAEQSIIDYNDDIFEKTDLNTSSITMDKSIIGGIYTLNEKDEFYVKVKNINTTMAGAIFDAIIPTAKKERIIADCGGIVRNNSWAKVDADYMSAQDIVAFWNYDGDATKNRLENVIECNNDNSKVTFTFEGSSIPNTLHIILYEYDYTTGDYSKKVDNYSKRLDATIKPGNKYKLVVERPSDAKILAQYYFSTSQEIKLAYKFNDGTNEIDLNNGDELSAGKYTFKANSDYASTITIQMSLYKITDGTRDKISTSMVPESITQDNLTAGNYLIVAWPMSGHEVKEIYFTVK